MAIAPVNIPAGGVNLGDIAQMLQLQQYMQQQQQQQQIQQQNQQVERLLSQYGTGRINQKDFLGGAFAIDPKMAFKYQQQFASSDTTQRNELLKKAADDASLTSSFLSAPKDQAQWQMQLEKLKAIGVDTKGIPEVYKPEYQEFIVQAGQSAGDNLKRLKIQAELGQVKNAQEHADILFGIDLADKKREIARKAAGLPAADKVFGMEKDLRTEFIRISDHFIGVRNAKDRLDAVPLVDNGVNDLAYVFQLIKMMDPTSTVSPSEQASVSNTPALPDQVRNIWNNLVTGGRLSDVTRKQIRKISTSFYTAAEDTFKKTTNKYETLAKGYGLNPENVISTIPTENKKIVGTPLPVTGAAGGGATSDVESKLLQFFGGGEK